MKPRDGLALFPTMLGLAILIALRDLIPSIPVLVIRIDLGLVALMAGLTASGVVLLAVVLRRRQAVRREAAVEAEKLKRMEAQRRFMRRLDHELKNPLTGIRAALANLEEDCTGDAARSALPDIRHQAERLAKLTFGLRKLADLEEIPLDWQRVNVGTLLEEAVEAVRAHPVGAGRDLRLVIPRVPWPLADIQGDADMLGLAFFNLIENALKFSGAQDTVEVRAAEHGREVQVEIADTGSGIPEGDLPRLFEELYRGENARGREGSGLGLALVQRVIDRHGGAVSVRSRRDGGKGTVFTVTLPIRPPAAPGK